MLEPIEAFVLKCDNCNDIYSDDNDTGFSIFSDGSAAQQAAESDGWHKTAEGKHYCPDCHIIDENDELVVILMPGSTAPTVSPE